jgi:hypothetical protein
VTYTADGVSVEALAPQPEAFTFTQGSPEHTKLRERFLTDLYWAASVVLGYGEQVPMREHAHRALCRIVEGRTGCPEIDERHVQKLELPRDWGKTTILTRARVVQLIAGNPNISILLCNEKEGNAVDFLAAVKWHFESNDFFRALFPEIVPPDFNQTVWSAKRIVVPRSTGRSEPTVFVTGVGGTVTGMHPDVIIVDDMISRDAMENARAGSWQIMHQVNRWINSLPALISKQYKDWRIYFMGTRWWHGDSYEHVDKAFGYGEEPRVFNLRIALPDGTAQVLPVHIMGDLVTFRRAAIEHGRSSFPEKWSLEDLAKLRMRDEALFACNYMNQPSDERTSTFKESWLRYFEWVTETQLAYVDQGGKKNVITTADLDVQFFVDPGGFAKNQAEDRARPAVVVVGDDRKGQWLVLDIYNEHDTYLACIEQICAWITRYNPRKIICENAGQQIAFIQLLRNTIRDKGFKTVVDECKTGQKNKEVRILGLEPFFQRGQFLIGRGAAFHSFREQYTQFPRTARKDVLDVLAYVPQFAAHGAKGARSTEQRRDAELTAYRRRRGMLS